MSGRECDPQSQVTGREGGGEGGKEETDAIVTVGSLDTAAGLAPDHDRTTLASSVGGWSDDMIVIPQSPHTHTHTLGCMASHS